MGAERRSFRHRASAIVGGLACLGLGAVALGGGRDGARAWLAASLATISLPIGALGLSMMTTLIPGAWRDVLKEPIWAVGRLMLPAAALFLPVLARLPAIYPWAGSSERTAFRQIYLAPLAFDIRAVVLLSLFAGLAFWTRRRESTRAAAVGLLLYVPATTVAAVDWLLSLDPRFASSGFGLYVLCLQMMSALAAAAMLGVRRSPRQRLPVVGAVLLTALLLWAYFAFMQYFIVWSGNLPAGVAWYQRRGQGFWAVLIGAAAACRLTPAFLLLFSTVRASAWALAWIASAVLLGSVLEMAWLALPGSGSVALLLYPFMLLGMAPASCGVVRLASGRKEAAA